MLIMHIRKNDQCYAEKLFTAERFRGQDSIIMANIFYIICGLYKGRFKGTTKEDQNLRWRASFLSKDAPKLGSPVFSVYSSILQVSTEGLAIIVIIVKH